MRGKSCISTGSGFSMPNVSKVPIAPPFLCVHCHPLNPQRRQLYDSKKGGRNCQWKTQLSYVESIPKLSQQGFWLGLTLLWDPPSVPGTMRTSHVSSRTHGTAPNFRPRNRISFLTSFVIFLFHLRCYKGLLWNKSRNFQIDQSEKQARFCANLVLNLLVH